MSRCAVLLAALLGPAVGLGCAGVRYERVRLDREPPGDATALEPGTALANCLALLGPPTEVAADDEGGAFVLTWEWKRDATWGFFVTLPLGRRSGSLNWTALDSGAERVRLVFDADARLLARADD